MVSRGQILRWPVCNSSELPDLSGDTAGPVHAALGQLTSREQEVLLEVATGLSNNLVR
jgi:DNA-binding NarL/FixJ family response regulator